MYFDNTNVQKQLEYVFILRISALQYLIRSYAFEQFPIQHVRRNTSVHVNKHLYDLEIQWKEGSKYQNILFFTVYQYNNQILDLLYTNVTSRINASYLLLQPQ